MLFEFNRYSALLLIFFVHGLVYALLLWQRARREERRADGWLSFFLLLCVLYIVPWMTGFADWYDTQPYRDLLFYVPFQHLFALGPVVFFYTQSLLNPSFRFKRRHLLHFLPSIGYLLFSVVMVVVDKIILGRAWFLQSGMDPDFDTWYQVAGFVSMTAYGWLSLKYYSLFRRLMLMVTSFADRLQFLWVQHFLQAFLVMLLLRFTFFVASLLGADDYSDTWWYFMGFALLFYYIAIKGYSNTVQPVVAYQPLLAEQKAILLLPAKGIKDDSFIAEEEPIEVASGEAPANDPYAEQWKPRILQVLEGEGLYKDPDLKLSTLARKLGMPTALLSRVINKGFGCNFNDLVNRCRVEAVQKAFSQGSHYTQTLLGVAFDCGFNSKATFNRAFLKHAGQSPRDYLARESQGTA